MKRVLEKSLARLLGRQSASSTSSISNKGDGGKSDMTMLVNETPYVLYFRDKVGSAYGGTRYKLKAQEQMFVKHMKHSYFKMLIYAAEEHHEHGSERASEKITPRDTFLSIDNDMILDCVRIVISFDATTGRYSIAATMR